MKFCFKRLLPPALCAALLLAGGVLFPQSSAQAGGNPAAGWPARLSGEFAFYRDYTFADPAWTGVLFYDEGTWAAQVLFPESGKRVTSFFSAEAEGDRLVLTGQRNDPNLQNEDVPLVNYLMQILPLLWEARQAIETRGEAIPPSTKKREKSIFPPAVSLQRRAPLFGGDAEFVFSAELPLFGLKSVSDSGGRAVFAFESAGRISADDDSAFFAFEPVPQQARREIADARKDSGGKKGKRAARKSRRGKAEAVEEIIAVAPNFFLAGDTAAIVTGAGDIGGLSPELFYALAAKNFLLSGDADVLPVPETFECVSDKGGVWLDQILYLKDEKTPMRKRMLLQADFAGGKYSFAEVSCFESAFEENKARVESVAASLLAGE